MTRNDSSQPSTRRDTAGTLPFPAPFGLDTMLETQARLWNHLLDANRSIWALYTPWLPGIPWPQTASAAETANDEEGMEPATTADGVPDALELQARSWNRLLDAQKSFWTSINWPLPMLTPASEGATAELAADLARPSASANSASGREPSTRKNSTKAKKTSSSRKK